MIEAARALLPEVDSNLRRPASGGELIEIRSSLADGSTATRVIVAAVVASYTLFCAAAPVTVRPFAVMSAVRLVGCVSV